MTQTLFVNGRVLDPRFEGPRGGMQVLVEDGTIREVSDRHDPQHHRGSVRPGGQAC